MAKRQIKVTEHTKTTSNGETTVVKEHVREIPVATQPPTLPPTPPNASAAATPATTQPAGRPDIIAMHSKVPRTTPPAPGQMFPRPLRDVSGRWVSTDPHPLVAQQKNVMRDAGFDDEQIMWLLDKHVIETDKHIRDTVENTVGMDGIVPDEAYTEWFEHARRLPGWSDEARAAALNARRADTTMRELYALRTLPERVRNAQQSLDRELRFAAGWYDTTEEAVTATFHELYAQAKTETLTYQEMKPARKTYQRFYNYSSEMLSPPLNDATVIALYRLHTDTQLADTFPKQNRPIVVFDTETSGLHSDREVLTLAMRKYTASGELLAVETYAFRPTTCTPDGLPYTGGEKSMSIHGVHPEDVLDKPPFAEHAEHIHEFLDGSTLAAHNLPFDVTTMQREFARAGVPLLERPTLIDTLRLSRQFNPDRWKHTMGVAAECYGVEHDPTKAHDADYDTAMCAGVLFAIKENPVRTFSPEQK